MKKVTLLFIGLLLLVVILIGVAFGLYYMSPAERDGEGRVFIVNEGSSLQQVASELKQKEIIKSKSLFMLWARLRGHSRRIKAGEYDLSPSMSPVEILEKLTRGTVVTHPVTIPEGYTAAQIAELLEKEGLVNKEQFLSLTKDPTVLSKYGIPGSSLEGYLYPDTYQFARGISAVTVIDTMIGRFHEVVGPLRETADNRDMEMDQVIILASIVEKETGLAEERPTIASVFLNRLERRMRLESDPTVIYGIEDFDGNLRRKDLTNPTPYNTYVIRGLPPGPIANPGEDAIKAVLYPAKTDYLYFVSKNDGSHHFSKTLPEHNRAVQKYQKSQRMRRGKTP